MRNVTITLDAKVLEAARRDAAARGISLNAFLRELISRSLGQGNGVGASELFELMDRLPKTTEGITWKREDLYRG